MTPAPAVLTVVARSKPTHQISFGKSRWCADCHHKFRLRSPGRGTNATIHLPCAKQFESRHLAGQHESSVQRLYLDFEQNLLPASLQARTALTAQPVVTGPLFRKRTPQVRCGSGHYHSGHHHGNGLRWGRRPASLSMARLSIHGGCADNHPHTRPWCGKVTGVRFGRQCALVPSLRPGFTPPLPLLLAAKITVTVLRLPS